MLQETCARRAFGFLCLNPPHSEAPILKFNR